MSVPESPESEGRPLGSARDEDRIFRDVYSRLKDVASRQIARDRGITLNTTELVHEFYERLTKQEVMSLGGPRNLFGYAANAMRNILIDRARHRLTQKSGGDWIRVTASHHEEAAEHELAAEVLALDGALERLAVEDERAAKVVELRYFAGLSMEQIADVMGLTRRTVTRDWAFARAFLAAVLQDE